jgi:hypothetical protein
VYVRDEKKLGSVTVGCYRKWNMFSKAPGLSQETGRCMDYWNAVCVAMRHVL